MPRGDWDDISLAQRTALRVLLKHPNGCAEAWQLSDVRLSTLRALHRYGLVKASDDIIQEHSVVTITPSGRDSADVPEESP